ncbi:hypothetical protein [Thalassotalea atypica]|uniref:hypothetical protein n=1 Tax=Thalassotalea atypica TaxID=2054316 RepID=UPI0025734351|nr:hypothetical protein [Thalassotalea atypica]
MKRIVEKRIFMVLLLLALTGCFSKDEMTVKTIEPKCISSQSTCAVDTPQGRFFISFDQESPKAETPVNLYVNYLGEHEIIKISAHMEGVDMFMGKIPLFFVKQATAQEEASVFNAQVLFGSCSLAKMKWKIIFIIDSENNDKLTQHSFFVDLTTFR